MHDATPPWINLAHDKVANAAGVRACRASPAGRTRRHAERGVEGDRLGDHHLLRWDQPHITISQRIGDQLTWPQRCQGRTFAQYQIGCR